LLVVHVADPVESFAADVDDSPLWLHNRAFSWEHRFEQVVSRWPLPVTAETLSLDAADYSAVVNHLRGTP